jgi:hypothetical protein
MKRIIIATVLVTGALAIQAQEKLSRAEALQYAFFTCADLKEMLNTPIPTDPDVKRPVGVKDGDMGGMVLPEAKLSADTFAKAGKEPKSVGQLWLRGLTPMNKGEAVAPAKLRIVHVRAMDQEADAVCCALGVCKDADGGLELVILGKDKEPVTRAAIKSASGQQENPIEISAERKDDSGVITMKFLGQYEATFSVTALEE